MEKHSQLQDSAYQYLKQEIIEGNFSTDRDYSLGSIAKELGMSKTPVRDALRRLDQEGFVDILPSRGVRICALTDRDLVKIYQMRCSVEGYCCMSLAENPESDVTQHALRLMRENLKEQEEIFGTSKDVAAFLPVDRQFHDILICALENDYFSAMNRSYNERITQFANRSLKQEGVLKITLEEHREIYDAICRGDGIKSQRALFAHLGTALSVNLSKHGKPVPHLGPSGLGSDGRVLRLDRDKTLSDYENEIIRAVVKEEGDNLTRAARRLGIGRSTLWRKLEKP